MLFGGREHGSDDHEILGAGLSTESAGDFLPQLHHAGIAFGLIVGEGHDEGVNLAGQQINPGQQADSAMALVFMIAREGRVPARLRRRSGAVVAIA